jgi:hypothetical protein
MKKVGVLSFVIFVIAFHCRQNFFCPDGTMSPAGVRSKLLIPEE